MNGAFLALGLAGLGYLVFGRRGEPGDVALPGSPQPLRAGVRYLFLVRLEAPEAEARATLEAKNVENLEFAPASVPPFWTQPGELYSTRVAAFRVAPQGNGTITLGDPFYGIGRLEKVVRLDGQPFDAEAAVV